MASQGIRRPAHVGSVRSKKRTAKSNILTMDRLSVKRFSHRARQSEAQDQTPRMTHLPFLNVPPFHDAQRIWPLDQLGLQVELVAVKSAQKRDTLMQTRQVDRTLQKAGVPPAQIALQEPRRWIPDFAGRGPESARRQIVSDEPVEMQLDECLPYASPFWREWPDDLV